MSGEAGVFARKNPALVGDELAEQVGVLKIQGIHRKINFGLGTRGADF